MVNAAKPTSPDPDRRRNDQERHEPFGDFRNGTELYILHWFAKGFSGAALTFHDLPRFRNSKVCSLDANSYMYGQ
jgi:hypothetical protein